MSHLATPRHEHDHPHLRRICSLNTANGEHIQVDHIFDNHVCAEHGVIHAGVVGLFTCDLDESGEPIGTGTGVALAASEALLLANRLCRAAALVLEDGEDPADLEREIIQHHRGALNLDGGELA